MKKKLLFLIAAFAICATPLTSCSKDDEPTSSEVTLKSVEGTKWTTVYGHEYAELWFHNGKFSFTGGIEGYGTYTQNGNTIIFDGGRILMPFPKRAKTGSISSYGSSMNVTFVDDDATGQQTVVKFTYCPM